MARNAPRSEWRTRHWRHVWLVGIFTFTGLGLFLPQWRSALGFSLPAVQAVHEGGGILYGIALVAVSVRFFPWPAKPRPFVNWAYFFLAGLSVTGAGLLVGPSWTRSIATVGHGAFAAAFVLWSGWHLVTHAPVSFRLPQNSTGMPFHIRRRRFLRWTAGFLVGLPAFGALSPLLKMVGGRILPEVGPKNSGALPGFVPYTVVNGFPHISTQKWQLTVSRKGAPVKTWSYSEFTALNLVNNRINFQCVTGWAVDNVRFSGIDLISFLKRHDWNPETEPWVIFKSGDGVYTDSLSAKQITVYHPLLANAIDGQPLPVSQGHPVRLVVPGMYGYKSVKWLIGLEFSQQDHRGFWEVRGYPQDAYIGSYRPMDL